MFILALIAAIFCFRWQVVEASKFTQVAAARFKNFEIPAARGTIYAKDGSTLAYSEPRFNVYVYVPELAFAEGKGLQTRTEFTDKIAPILDTTGEQLRTDITKNTHEGINWIKVAETITLEKRNQIKNLKRDLDGGEMFGAFFEATYERIYPEGKLASQVLGLTSVSEQGQTTGLGGLEGEWDGYLEPLKGFISGEQDAKGNAIGTATEKTIEAKRGSSIYTSIDKKLQAIVEEKLEWAVDEYGAASGTVIIMDPKTGEILAMANYPDYDPNLREETDPNVYGNKAVSEPYEIGSVGKIMTLSAAIDTETVTPDSVIINGHNGCEEITKELEPVCTHDKLPQPAMPIKDAFALSDNIYFLHLAQLMDKEVFYTYLSKFGVGKPSGVDVAGESYGYLKNWENWNIADVSAYSYGHSYQVNALQALSAAATVANYGVRMQPHFVTKVVEEDGTEKMYEPVAVERVIKKETTLQMDEMMHVIYSNNIFYWEHHYDDLRNYKIALKSGTALIPYRDRPGYSNDYNATYIGYDASPDRTFAMLVRLERPQWGTLASANARILWLEIFAAMKDYLGVRRIGEF